MGGWVVDGYIAKIYENNTNKLYIIIHIPK